MHPNKTWNQVWTGSNWFANILANDLGEKKITKPLKRKQYPSSQTHTFYNVQHIIKILLDVKNQENISHQKKSQLKQTQK